MGNELSGKIEFTASLKISGQDPTPLLKAGTLAGKKLRFNIAVLGLEKVALP
jgi:hypothetical protein